MADMATNVGSLSGRTARRRVLRVSLRGSGRPGGTSPRADFLAGEPLGVRVDGTALTLTMRTEEAGLTLVGLLRGLSMNVYAGAHWLSG